VTLGSKTYSQAGVFRDTLRAITGCDSIVTLNITVTPPLSYTQNLSICEGDFVQVGAKRYSQTGIFTDTIKTLNGCDSIVTTNLTVNKKYSVTQNASICQGGIYTIGAKTYTQAGVYRDTFKTITGCDSVLITDLSIKTTATRTQNIARCAGQSITVGTKTYTQTGIYRDTFRTVSGCDSIVITDLTIHNVSVKNQDLRICTGESVRVGAKIYTTPGIFKDTLQNVWGCDSIITTNLTVLPPLSFSQNVRLCEGDIFKIGIKTYNQTGVYQDTFKNINGCDSIVTTNLTFLKKYNEIQTVSICPNGVYTIGKKTYTQAGIYRDTFKTINGCDSIIITDLSIKTSATKTQNAVLCTGQSFKIGIKTYTQAGLYRDTFRSASGCDSIIVTNLSFNPISVKNQTVEICQGESLRVGVKTYTASGIYRDTLLNATGCDSIITTNLTVTPPFVLTQNIRICEGDFIKIGVKTYTQAGNYVDTLKSTTGCDSIVTTRLTVLRTTFSNQNIAICTGQSYTIGSKTYTQAGIYRDTFRNFIGCDSVVITSLSIAPAITKAQSVTVCEGSVITVGNNMYSRSGVYRDTLQASAGCDSIVVTTLTVNQAPERQLDTTLCEGNSLVFNGTTYSKSGTYRITVPRAGTCDSTLVLNITVRALAIEKREIVLCANDSVVINGKVWRDEGVVIDTSAKANPCRSIIEWHIKKSTLDIDLGADISLIQGDSVQLTPSVTGAQKPIVRWLPHPALSCLTCLTPIAKPSGSTVYIVQLSDSITRCRVSDSVRVSVRSCANTYLPTAFSPDKDGINDYFAVRGFGCIKSIRRMQIFNRWGNLVFSKDNISPTSEDEGWDGTMNNRLMPPDVYVYMVELELLNGKMEIVAGDITLLR
jgi:gliding motility-associated-like protein